MHRASGSDTRASDGKLETPGCPLCGCALAKRFFEAEFHPYALARCQSCAFHFLSPRAPRSEMAERYREADYYGRDGSSGYDDYQGQATALGRTFARMVSELHRRGLTGGDLLEVGCGYGYFLEKARGRFRRIEATEFSLHAIDKAKRHADAVFAGGIESVPPGRQYDLLVALQVLEHVYEPRLFLRELRERLRPGGHLLLGVPDMASPWRILLGPRWPSFKIPEHVLYFEKASLHRLMREEGFLDVVAMPYPHAFSLRLLAGKFGIELPSRFDGRCLWVPRTTLAAIGKR